MKKYILFAVSLGLVLGLNIYFRTFPINLPQLKNRARDITEQKIRQEVIQEVNKQFPEFDALVKDRLIKTLISDYKRQKKDVIKSLIQEGYLKLKDQYQDTAGQTYLMELDCWHWARYVDNVVHSGRIGDEIINGKQIDSLMQAPHGNAILWNRFLFYLSGYLYKIFSLIMPVPLFTFLFYLPLFFITIFIIVLYLFCFYHWGNMVAVITGLFVGLSPIFLVRSCVGWFDTDILNLLFPLLTVWAYLSVYSVSSLTLRILCVCLSGFWVGLFCFTWLNWWFIVLVIMVYEFYSLLNLLFVYWQYKEKNLTLFKRHLFSLLLFLLFSFFWIIVFVGFEPLRGVYFQVKEGLILNKPITASIWPNVYSTVGELKKADFRLISGSVGNAFLFIFSLASILILFMHTPRKPRYSVFQRESMVIMTFWFIIMFLACFKGMRFSIFLIIPLGISLAWGLKEVYEYFKNKKKKWIIVLILAIIIILNIEFVKNAYNSAEGMFPFMNDTWYKVLTTIKETTHGKAIINSWWDFGDWFKTISKRRVIIDGQSQNTPQSYWMAHVLMTDDEEEAIGILRMLNNGGNNAFEIINRHINDPFKSVLLLEQIFSSETPMARDNLLKFLPSSVAEEVCKLLFAKPEKAYLVVDSTMKNKIISTSYIGNWNFTKLYITQNLNKKGKDQIIDYFVKSGADKQQVQRFYEEALLVSGEDLDLWVSPRFKFYSGLGKGEEVNDIVLFDNGSVYNTKDQTIYIYSTQDSKYIKPRSLFILKQDKLEEITYPNNDLDFSALVFKTQEGYRCILLDRGLAKSLFVRLFFLGGGSLKFFKPFMEEKDKDIHIQVFEIVWG